MKAVDYVAYLAMAAGGMTLAALALMLASCIVWGVGAQIWRRLRRIYRLTTIWFYLEKLEKTGRYHFPPPDKDNP